MANYDALKNKIFMESLTEVASSGCYCIGPQNGDPLCPCRMKQMNWPSYPPALTPPYVPRQTQMGWECPKCGAVHAPFISECRHCIPKK